MLASIPHTCAGSQAPAFQRSFEFSLLRNTFPPSAASTIEPLRQVPLRSRALHALEPLLTPDPTEQQLVQYILRVRISIWLTFCANWRTAAAHPTLRVVMTP